MCAAEMPTLQTITLALPENPLLGERDGGSIGRDREPCMDLLVRRINGPGPQALARLEVPCLDQVGDVDVLGQVDRALGEVEQDPSVGTENRRLLPGPGTTQRNLGEKCPVGNGPEPGIVILAAVTEQAPAIRGELQRGGRGAMGPECLEDLCRSADPTG